MERGNIEILIQLQFERQPTFMKLPMKNFEQFSFALLHPTSWRISWELLQGTFSKHIYHISKTLVLYKLQ